MMRPLVLVLVAVLAVAGCTKAKQEPPPKAAIEYFKVDQAKAGSLSGTVHFKGKPERGKLIKMDAEEDCQKLHSKPGLHVDKDVCQPTIFSGNH